MVWLQKGDILKANVGALVNTVNCVGVAGLGLALQFKKAYPENFKAYEQACKAKKVRPGNMFVFETGYMWSPKYIINFPTKRLWWDKSRIEDIESGLEALAKEIRKHNIHSIAIPPLGCGLGGLDWNIVRPMIEKTLEVLPDVRAVLFEPIGEVKKWEYN